MTLNRVRQATKRVALVGILSAAATIAALTASPALAAESSPYLPFTPATSAANTKYVTSSSFLQPGSDRMLNPQPLPPKQFSTRIFGR